MNRQFFLNEFTIEELTKQGDLDLVQYTLWTTMSYFIR